MIRRDRVPAPWSLVRRPDRLPVSWTDGTSTVTAHVTRPGALPGEDRAAAADGTPDAPPVWRVAVTATHPDAEHALTITVERPDEPTLYDLDDLAWRALDAMTLTVAPGEPGEPRAFTRQPADHPHPVRAAYDAHRRAERDALTRLTRVAARRDRRARREPAGGRP